MIELRKYQIETIEAARQELRNGKKRIIIQASCGSGKTILAADIVSSALEKDKKVLFLVHYRELAYQALERFQQYGIGDFCGLIMAGEDSKLNLPIQIASVQTYQRRLNFDEPESNQWFHNADLIIYDECFVLGTLIDGKPIESLNVGDKVYSYNSETGKIEKKRITKTFSSAPKSLCKVSMKDGRYIICTESHPVYSEGKYLTATSLLCDSAVGCIQEYRIKGEKNNEISENREMQNVRSRSAVFRGEAFPNIFISVKEGFGLLFRGLFEHNEKRTSQKVRKNACRNKQKGSFLTDEDKQPNGRPKKHRKDEGDKKSQRDIKYLPFSSWWKRTASSDSSTNDGGGFGMGYRTSDKHERPKYIKPLHKDSKILQGGHWKSKIKNWNRNRRSFSCWEKKVVGQEERQVLGTLRVESVEIYKQTSDGKFGGMCQDGYVYNIEVEDNNNYFANGVLVHNCHSSIAKTRKGILQMYIDKNKTILGLTATPCRSDGRGLGEIYEAIIPAIGISALTKQEYLVPCVYYGAKELPDLENIPIVAGDYNKKVLGERVDKVKLVGDIYDNWARLAIDRQTVIFATNVNHSKHIKELFQKRGVSCEHIDSYTPDEDRRDIYDNFRDGNIQVLTNCAILGEGVDFPWVSCVVLAKPSKSYARFVQMAGRGLRPHPGKAECLILDHSGLVFMHGFLDDEVCWSLDGKEIAWKKTTWKKEKKILDCEICGTLFSGNRCTQCGHEIKNYGKRIETTDDDLQEIGKNKKKDKELTTEEKKRWFAMLLGYARQKGYSEGWASHKYKEKMSVWPNKAKDIKPVSPDEEVLRYIKYQNIKWAKSKQKMEQTGHDQDSRNPRASERRMGWDICYPSDFNDLNILEGEEAVLSQLKETEEAEQQNLDAPAKDTLEATVQRLATLSLLQYDKVRKTEAKTLGIRVAILDSAVKDAHKGSGADDLPFVETSPWPEPVNPAMLLTDIGATIRRFIVCNEEVSHAVALWIAMTWFIDVIQVAPLAVITAPEKRCGKTLLLSLLSKLSARAITASSISPAALFRTIEAWTPTLLIDEADAFMKDNEELRGLLNSGHTRDSAYVIRTVGDNFTPTKFSTWGAKALAGIGHVADTLMDRAIILELRRKLPHEKVDRIRHAEPSLFDELCSKLARFADDYSEEVRQARPPLPNSLNDRAQDNWEPLLAIAMIAGDDWLRIGSTAALKLSGGESASQTIGTELLSDIQEIFEEKQGDRISTAELINALCNDDEKPWATYNRSLPIKPRQIAKKLKAYGIQSKTIRIGLDTAKGYEREQFKDVFIRSKNGATA